MATPTNHQWRLRERPVGPTGPSHFTWAESPIPQAADGQFVVRNEWISLDPHTAYDLRTSEVSRGSIALGAVVPSLAVGRIVESRRPGFAVGDRVLGVFGWEEYTLTDGQGAFPTTKLADAIPAPLALGALGLTGLTAYFGTLEVGQIRRGETLLVSGAAGAVGSVAAQIGRIEGLRVVAVAGGPEKCAWLRAEARIPEVIDYRNEDLAARVAELCPKGVDVVFDNVGGPFLDVGLARLRRRGRVVLCGAISRYEAETPPPGPKNYANLILRHGRMEGFLVTDYVDRFPEAQRALSGWLRAGEIRTKEDVVVGLAETPRAFARLFRGENFGKQLVRLDPGASDR